MEDYKFESEKLFERYLRDIEKFSELSPEEELALFRKIKEGDKSAKEKVLKSYLKLVVNIAKTFYKDSKSYSLLDLISEGNIGLIRAIEKFNPEKGIKFSTYASWWIKQAMKRNLNGSSKLVKVPSHVDELIRCFFKTLKTNKNVSFEDKKEAAENVGVNIDIIEDLLTKYKDSISLHNYDDDKSCLEDIIEDTKCADPLSIYEKKELFENLLEWIKVLNEKEKKVIILRYGLNDDVPMTLEEVGNIMGLTRERIRQIEEKALNKLRFYLLKLKPNFF